MNIAKCYLDFFSYKNLECRQFETQGINAGNTKLFYIEVTHFFSLETRYAVVKMVGCFIFFFLIKEYSLHSYPECETLPRRHQNIVVMFKICVTKLPHQIPTVEAQRFFRAVKCGPPNGMAQGRMGPTNGSLCPGHRCSEERRPFPNYHQSPSQRRAPHIESKWSVKDGQPAGDKFPEKPVVAAEPQNSWFGQKAVLVGTIIWHVLTQKLRLKSQEELHCKVLEIKWSEWVLYRNI